MKEVGGTYKILEARDHGDLDKLQVSVTREWWRWGRQLDGPGKVSISENI